MDIADSQYATPLVVPEDGCAEPLERVPLSGAANGGHFDEAWLQALVFEHPECLPVAEIDRAYLGLIPVCRELNTPAGPIDALYVTPQGKLAILEAKLWRNPEARRKVVGQILDYAKEVSRWGYEDLQRAISQATGRAGDRLHDIVASVHPGLDEATFHDAVARSLRKGEFLLVIVGDGIREGVGAIAEFLDRFANLHFTFGLVELASFAGPGAGYWSSPE